MERMDWIPTVIRAQRGDREAFGTLVRRFQDMAVGYSYSLLLDFPLAEDAAQEAFLQCYLHLPRLRDPEAFPAWFRRIVFSQCTRHLRGRRPLSVPIECAASLPDFDSGRQMEEMTLRETLRRAFLLLSEAERAAVILFHLQGYSHREIAAMLSIPISTIKSRLHSARGKLRVGLLTERETLQTMEQTWKENAPDPGFGKRVLERVETLSWGVSGDCTFSGALAAATAVTPHPYDYQTLMGVTGLAFRTRWFQGNQPRWCPSSPVGEFPEEVEAARKATGWTLRVETAEEPMARLAPKIVASIDAGLPVLAYDSSLNMGVIAGYEDEGRTFLMRGYMCGEDMQAGKTADLPMFALFLEEHTQPLLPLQAAQQGIGMAAKNWSRGHDPENNLERGYWHGTAALAHWSEDIGRFDSLSEEERGMLFFVSWWNFGCLADARHQAAPFLRQVMPLFGQKAKPILERAAAVYTEETGQLGRTFLQKDVFMGPWTGKNLNDWTESVREQEQEILTEANRLEAAAIALLEEALSVEARS